MKNLILGAGLPAWWAAGGGRLVEERREGHAVCVPSVPQMFLSLTVAPYVFLFPPPPPICAKIMLSFAVPLFTRGETSQAL